VLPESQRERVRVTGRLGQAEIVRLRCEAAITLVCSRWENQPNTALEALLQACPVVGFDAGGMPEVVEHGVSGLLARGADIEDLCRQVLWLLDHPQEAEQFGRRGREHVMRAHGVQAVATRTVAYYQELLQQHGAQDAPAAHAG
jgi:glycosyltransferase involved in cell wall biosynthesis